MLSVPCYFRNVFIPITDRIFNIARQKRYFKLFVWQSANNVIENFNLAVKVLARKQILLAKLGNVLSANLAKSF